MAINKIVVAIDSFKGSLSSKEAAGSIEKGIRSVLPSCEVVKARISDGGGGMTEALVETLGGSLVETTVHDPLMRPVRARYGIVDNGKTAVMEMASASGLVLVEPELRNPMLTTTAGTGEMILDALSRGCRRFRIGIGGSATNDAGTGMLQALGFRFLDGTGNDAETGGRALSRIETIDDSQVPEEVREAEFTIACDVSNPFSGPSGAACVYAPQKGADEEMVRELDNGLRHFASVIRRFNGIQIEHTEGAGAAGGLGGGFAAFLGASLVSGIELVLEAIGFDQMLDHADLVITGEGKLDAQTVMGKAPRGVLDAALRREVPVIGLGGSVEGAGLLNECGFAAVFPILPAAVTLEQAMGKEYTEENLERTARQLIRFAEAMNR